MILSTILFIFCFSIVSVQQSSQSQDEWEVYKTKFGKNYANLPIIHSLTRREIFLKNKQYIDYFNSDALNNSFKLDLNHLADWTDEELGNLNGFRWFTTTNRGERNNSLSSEEIFLKNLLNSNQLPVPEEWDWRNVAGVVSEVKDQKFCSSCWAFAAAGALEGQEIKRARLSKKSLKLQSLSVQSIIDCSKSNKGCDTGNAANALVDIGKQQGIEADDDYPYEAVEGDCRFDLSKVVIRNEGAVMLNKGDEDELKVVVARFGPVAVGIDASGRDFTFYKRGVYFSNKCSKSSMDVNHSALLVGYGSDSSSGDYWIVKNSWSSNWGESGYIRMARNRDNNCGIASAAVIPTF